MFLLSKKCASSCNKFLKDCSFQDDGAAGGSCGLYAHILRACSPFFLSVKAIIDVNLSAVDDVRDISVERNFGSI